MYFLTPCVVEELHQSTCNATALYAFWPLARVCMSRKTSSDLM